METMEQRLEKLEQLVERNFEKSGLNRELEDLIAKANAQIKANPQAIEQINNELKKDFYEVMGRNQAAGWVDGPWVDEVLKNND